MPNKLTILILLYILLAVSCFPDQKTEEGLDTQKIEVNLDELEDIHKSGLIKDVRIIQLDDNIPIGEIDKFIKYKKYMYIADYDLQSVVVFDTLGNLINGIADMGRSGEEYAQLTDILVNDERETLELNSRIDQKLLVYTLDGRELSDVIKTPKPFYSLAKTKDGYIGELASYQTDVDAKNVWTLTDEMMPVAGYIDIPPDMATRIHRSRHPLSVYKEHNYYTQVMDNNIYRINGNSETIPFTVDYGEYNLPEDKRTLDAWDEMTFVEKHNYVFSTRFFQETENYLIFIILHRGQNRLIIYDKHKEKSKTLSLTTYADKYFFPFGDIIGIDENAIYTILDPITIRDILIGANEHNDFESEYPEQIKRFRALFDEETIEEESNPFLVTYCLNITL